MKYRMARWILAAGLFGAVAVFAARQQDINNTTDGAQTNTPYLAIARGWVDISGGIIHITSQLDGIVDKVLVEEGDVVGKNQELVRLDTKEARINVAIRDAELSRAMAAKSALDVRLSYVQRHARKLSAAARVGASSGTSADETVMKVEQLKAQIAAASAEIRIARQHQARARHALERCSVRAQVAGRIVKRTVHIGDSVTGHGGTVLFDLIPDKPLIIRAEVNETFVDRIQPGQEAEIVVDGNNSIFKAKLLRVGDVFGVGHLSDDPEQHVYERDVQCILSAPQSGLRIGQRVLVRFLAKP